jgi:hypothetical protein
MIARQATANAPVVSVQYSDQEQQYRDEIEAFRAEWNRLRAKWSADNGKLVAKRKRAEVIASHLQMAKVIVKTDEPDVVTSVSGRPNAVQANHASGWLADTVVIRRPTVRPQEVQPTNEIPFPLTRPVLRGKARPAPKPGRVSAIGNFFKCVAVFVNG